MLKDRATHPEPTQPVPKEAVRVASVVHPNGYPYLILRDELGTIFKDEDFVDFFPKRGQSAFLPWLLALVTILRFREKLSGRLVAGVCDQVLISSSEGGITCIGRNLKKPRQN